MEKISQNSSNESENPANPNHSCTSDPQPRNNCLISDSSFNYEIYIDLIEDGNDKDKAVYGATGTETLEEARKKIELKYQEH